MLADRPNKLFVFSSRQFRRVFVELSGTTSGPTADGNRWLVQPGQTSARAVSDEVRSRNISDVRRQLPADHASPRTGHRARSAARGVLRRRAVPVAVAEHQLGHLRPDERKVCTGLSLPAVRHRKQFHVQSSASSVTGLASDRSAVDHQSGGWKGSA